MRDKWYSDNRDLVKWGVLLQLAELHNITTILQVAYYRSDPWESIEIDGCPYPLPRDVVRHFRNINNIVTLRSTARVDVLDAPFYDRDQYLEHIRTAIRNLPKEPAIVFLDPDTGLEPRKAKLEHVRQCELREIWHALRRGDLLVFYQHRIRDRQWVSKKQAQFENALRLEPGGSKLAQGTEIARDVVFFFRQRLDASQTAQAAR